MMHLYEYQQRLSKLNKGDVVSFEYGRTSDAMPGWLPALEYVSKTLRAAVKRIVNSDERITVRYRVDRVASSRGDIKLSCHTFWNEIPDEKRDILNQIVSRTTKRFKRRVQKICALCGDAAQNPEVTGAPSPRCSLHQFVEVNDMKEDTWDDLYGDKMRASADCLRILRESLARWMPLLHDWPHKTRPLSICMTQGHIDVSSAQLSSVVISSVRFIDLLALRSLVKLMGGNVESKSVIKWLDDVTKGPVQAYASGVDTIAMLGSVIVVFLQEHGSPLLIVAALDGFLAMNGHCLITSTEKLALALNNLAEGVWSASAFAEWLTTHIQRSDHEIDIRYGNAARQNAEEVTV